MSSASAEASDLISGAQHDADRIVDNARADADEMPTVLAMKLAA